ncbi:sensor histidine kinase [Brachybacterium sp. FME24]|uniref:sensor histidine kinase n=1 Tax=Brachybacterium sp. FME24 TaxID=2742605 RepID=UPI00186764E4|nr:sensor histidine kinase [Brachybacterium sp. FME24]
MAVLPAPAPAQVEHESDPLDAREPTRQGPLGAILEVWLPPVLLLVAWTVGWSAAGPWLAHEQLRWALLPTGLLLLLRGLLEITLRRAGPGGRPLLLLYGLHLVLVAFGILLNPLTCIYAFIGYIDAPRFLRGAWVHVAVMTTALLCAVGQVGGPQVALAEPWFFVGLAVVNLLLALAMMFVAGERERILDQRERAQREADRVNRENHQLHEQLMIGARTAGAGEERARLSREIHDTVAQGLVGVIRQLEAVGADIDPGSRQRITIAEEAARDCLLEARRAVEALGPHQLHGMNAVDALSDLVARWARAHRVVATFDADTAPRDGRHGDVLVRIAQEALANVARHSGARTVTVTLSGNERHRILQITDDGGGYDPVTVVRGHGLANMTERARSAGGDLGVRSAPGRGCTVTAAVPT